MAIAKYKRIKMVVTIQKILFLELLCFEAPTYSGNPRCSYNHTSLITLNLSFHNNKSSLLINKYIKLIPGLNQNSLIYSTWENVYIVMNNYW